MMKTVYLIMQDGLYGNDLPVRVYATKENADKFVDEYNVGKGHRHYVYVEEIQMYGEG